MKPLYQIDNEIMDCVDLETGEIIDEERLNALEMEREKKIEGVILWRKDLLAEADAVRSEAQNLSKRVKVCENKAEQLKNYINYALGGEKFKTERCSVSYRKSTSIVIDDFHDIKPEYWKDFKEDWISKDAIKKAIEKGETVKGVHQEEKMGIVIR